ncbi:MAG: tetratricopeptide repeat protein, partial [Verrucomicrobiota bacterium]
MTKAVTITIAMLLLVAAIAQLQAQPTPAKLAEEEGVRREEAKILLRQKLSDAQESERLGRFVEASKLYEEAFSLGQYVGEVVEDENRQTLTGLVAVRMELADQAQKSGNYEEADAQVTRVLKIDPPNAVAAAFKAKNDELLESMKGMAPSKEVLAQAGEIKQEKIKNAQLIQEGRFFYEMGKYDEAEEKLKLAYRADPSNKTAYYYMNLVLEMKQANEDRKRGYVSRSALVEVKKAWNSPVLRELLPKANPFGTTNLVHTSKGRQMIKSKLDRIRLQETPPFDGLVLSEIIKYLRDESIKRDPDKKGINFLINPHVDAALAQGAVTIDPNTGLPVPTAPQEVPDVNGATVRIGAMTDITLGNLIDAIIKSTDQQIKYSIEDYAVVFSRRNPEAVQLFTRTFRVDPNTFVQGLEGVVGVTFGDFAVGSGGGQGGGGQGGGGGGRGGGGGGGQGGGGGGQGGGGLTISGAIVPRVVPAGGGALGAGGAGGGGRGGGGGGFGGGGGIGGGAGGGVGAGGTGGGLQNVTTPTLTQQIQEVVRQYFTAAGVNFTQPTQNQLFFNDRTGILMVRASLGDLEIVETAIEVLNTAPSQVTIEAKFTEISQERFLTDWLVKMIEDRRT